MDSKLVLINPKTPHESMQLRIELHMFSLHWMMNNINFFNVCEAWRASQKHSNS